MVCHGKVDLDHNGDDVTCILTHHGSAQVATIPSKCLVLVLVLSKSDALWKCPRRLPVDISPLCQTGKSYFEEFFMISCCFGAFIGFMFVVPEMDMDHPLARSVVTSGVK